MRLADGGREAGPVASLRCERQYRADERHFATARAAAEGERRFAVYSLNPKQMDRFRDRHPVPGATVPGAKDDSRDAFVMADSLRTDLP